MRRIQREICLPVAHDDDLLPFEMIDRHFDVVDVIVIVEKHSGWIMR